jgi:hypothetical protein
MIDDINYIYEQVNGSHSAWRNNIARYKFFNNSYVGGIAYANAGYLPHFVYENGQDYGKRIESTPLDNHCRNIIQIYQSFLFSKAPIRDFAGIENDASLDDFLDDADLEKRDFNAFMRDASTLASIHGSALILVDRPAMDVETKADELTSGIRPYVSLVSAENIIDWEYERRDNGKYELVMLKILENSTVNNRVFRYYYRTHIDIVQTIEDTEQVEVTDRFENPLGYIPAVWLYNERSPVKGVGISDLTDLADLQKSIYSDYDELDSTLKLSNHPSLVMTRTGVDANAGPGAIIYVDETIPEQLKPYLLQPSSASVDSIIYSIKTKVDSIDRIAHLGGIRTTNTTPMSGVALQIERSLLQARLQGKANNLNIAEENIWDIWADWQNLEWNGSVVYPTGYSIRDTQTELASLKLAKELMPLNEQLNMEIDRKVAELVISDPDRLDNVLRLMEDTDTDLPFNDPNHPTLTSDNWKLHIQTMIDDGFTLAEIEAVHPELTQLMLADNVEI